MSVSREWTLRTRGGVYDGMRLTVVTVEPKPVMVVWACHEDGCNGHASFEPGDPGIVLDTAVSYRRAEMDEDAREAVYELPVPEIDQDAERELALVGAGVADLGDGWPVAP